MHNFVSVVGVPTCHPKGFLAMTHVAGRARIALLGSCCLTKYKRFIKTNSSAPENASLTPPLPSVLSELSG
jgi:hypothetical protein